MAEIKVERTTRTRRDPFPLIAGAIALGALLFGLTQCGRDPETTVPAATESAAPAESR